MKNLRCAGCGSSPNPPVEGDGFYLCIPCYIKGCEAEVYDYYMNQFFRPDDLAENNYYLTKEVKKNVEI